MVTPFVAGSDPTANLPDQNTFSDLADQWSTFLDKPGNRASLLSAGLALMQPPSFGDNAASQIGRAVGAAGETATRNEALDLKQQEAASKQDLRSAQAESAVARAGAAGTALELQRNKLDARMQQIEFQGRIKAAIEYPKVKAQIEAENGKRLRAWEANKLLQPNAPQPELIPLPSVQDYVAQRSQLLSGSGDAGGPGPAAPPSGTEGYIDAPRDPALRADGQRYNTPKGLLRWNAGTQTWER